MIAKLVFYILTIVFLVCQAGFGRNIVDMVTYADFNRIRDISASISHVYFVTTEGIIRFNKLENRWEEPLTGSQGVDHRAVFRVYVDQFDEKLYARTELASYEYDILFDSWYSINEIPQFERQYVHMKPPRIMYAPPGFNYTADGLLIDEFSRKFSISDMISEQGGNYWIGLWGYGAAVSIAGSGIIDLLPYGLIQNNVRTIYNDQGIIITGGESFNTFRSGITFFDPDNNEFEYLESGVNFEFPDEDVLCFEADDEYLYVGTSGGLILVNQDTYRPEIQYTLRNGLLDNEVLSLKKNGDTLYIGTSSGINLMVGETDSLFVLRPDYFINTEIYDFELTDSTLWIGSSTGAYQYHLKDGRLQQFQDPSLIIFSRATSIEHIGHELFLASDGGMVRLNLRTGQTTPYVSIVSGSRYRPLAVNKSIALLGTDHGFSLYYLTPDGYDNEREFTTSDGLPSDRIYSLLLDGDFVWIGTENGLVQFLWNDPDRID